MSFPEILKTKPDPSAFPQNMAVYSTRLDPVVMNDGQNGGGFLRFNLENNVGGILDQNSHLCLSLALPSNKTHCYYPAGIGIASLVKNCRLLIGGVEVASVNEWNMYQTVESTMSQGQTRKNYDTVKYGSNFYFKNNNDGASLPADARDTMGFGGDNYVALDKSNIGPQYLNTRVRDDDSTTFQGSIPISYLFKFMKERQLPIFLMDDAVSVEIDLQDDVANGFRYCNYDDYWAAGSKLVINDCYMLCDYMLYPAETMEAIADQQNSVGLKFDYQDVETNVSLINDPGNVTESTFVQNIGGVNQRLRNIKIVNQPALSGAVQTSMALGQYCSDGRYTQKSCNLKINNSNYFPDNDMTYPQLYANLVHCYRPLKNFIPRPLFMYNGDNDDFNLPPNTTDASGQDFQGNDQQVAFGGQMSVLGYNLTDMEDVPLMNGDIPIELNYYRKKVTNAGAPALNTRARPQ